MRIFRRGYDEFRWWVLLWCVLIALGLWLPIPEWLFLAFVTAMLLRVVWSYWRPE